MPAPGGDAGERVRQTVDETAHRGDIHVRQKGRWGLFVATPVEQGFDCLLLQGWQGFSTIIFDEPGQLWPGL
jgi:hypothetical protein